jgi:hypothetical protein
VAARLFVALIQIDVLDVSGVQCVSKGVGSTESGMAMALKWTTDGFIAGYEDGSVIHWKDGESELLHLFNQPGLTSN